MIWSKLQNIIDNHQSFLLSSHINPDGDSICSQLALYWYLTSLKKDVSIYNHDPVPDKFTFLHNSKKIENKFPQRSFDVFVIIDASNHERLSLGTSEKIAPMIINIDHHRDNSYEGDLNIVDVDASATSEMLYTFFKECSIDYPPYVAETLYAGILTDTGGFQFSNTSSSVLRICADLSEKGANCSKIYRKIYSSYSPVGLQLRAKIWSTLKFYSDNRISSMEMHEKVIKEYGANDGEIEGMSDLALTAAGVEVGMFIKYNNSSTHFSLRSKGDVDVGKVAQLIPGGGGHTCAAGCTIDLPIEKAKKKMLALIKKEIG